MMDPLIAQLWYDLGGTVGDWFDDAFLLAEECGVPGNAAFIARRMRSRHADAYAQGQTTVPPADITVYRAIADEELAMHADDDSFDSIPSIA